MKIPRTDRSSLISIVLLAILGGFIFLVSLQQQHWDADIFWALKSGEWIVTNFSVPLTDPFSYTFAGKEWIDFTWGFQVFVYIFYTYLGGWFGLFILQFLILLGTFYLLYKSLILASSGRGWLAIAALYLVFAATYDRFFIRPHLIAYLFVVSYIYLLLLHAREGKGRYLLYLLPLQILWANMHSSSILGIFIVGSYATGAFFSEIRKGVRSGAGSSFKFIVVVSFLVVAVSLINPYGWKLLLFPFIHQGGENAEALRFIKEWLPFPLIELFNLYPLPLGIFAFKVILLGVFASLVLNLRRLKLYELMLVLALTYMAFSHIRWTSVFAFFVAAILVGNFTRYMESRGRDSVILKRLCMALTCFVAVVFLSQAATTYRGNYGLGLGTGVFPEGTVEFMKREGVKGNIFNQYDFGGYLIYNYPELKVFMDSRTPTIYSSYFYWSMRQAVMDESLWNKIIKENEIDIALLKTRESACGMLWESEDWSAVAFDDVSVLYLRSNAGYSDLIDKWRLKSLNPCRTTINVRLPGDKAILLEAAGEARRLISYYKEAGLDGRVARPHWLLANISSSLGGEYLKDSVAQYRRALEISAEYPMHYELALVYADLGEDDNALRSFKKAAKGLNKSNMGLGLLYHKMGEEDKAQKYFDRYLKTAEDDAEHMVFKALAASCMNTGDFGCAVHNLKKAAFITDDSAELAYIYYNIGNALFAKGNYPEGVLYYRRAIAIVPMYLIQLRALQAEFVANGRKEKVEALSGLIIGTE
ncbi:hypothetical protein MNBD_DELTA01-1557 [hydrothermal vent metagenome]|uniref:Tetratricopeptide repeat protein n=1 Tax=hydrothermal vent metagenome TaxID=652676 RepID=A0A3B0RKB1_9ZZZZ